MPIMTSIERVFCRTPLWTTAARRAVPWALSGASLDGEVLEVGGGAGAMAVGMLDRFPGIRLTVVDLDPLMVQATSKRLSRFGPRAAVRAGDATALGFPDGSFDCVVSFLMLHHVGHWEAAVAEAVRVLRPGGRFVGYDLLDTRTSRFVHLDGELRSASVETFCRALAAAGISDPVVRRDRFGQTLRWIATKPAS